MTVRHQRHTGVLSAVYATHEISHLRHVAELQTVHRLDELAFHSVPAKQSHHYRSLFVCLREYTRRTAIAVSQQRLHDGLVQISRHVKRHFHHAIILSHRHYRSGFHPGCDFPHKTIGESHHTTGTTEVLRHLHETGVRHVPQCVHIHGAGASEFEYVLVVITDCDDTHILIIAHYCLHKLIFVIPHVLSLVYYKHGLACLVRFHIPVSYHFRRLMHHVHHVVPVSYSPQQVKTIRVECLYLHKVCRISYKFHEPLLEFCGCRTRESEHEQLLVLHVLKQQKRCEFVHQHARLSASGSRRYHYASRTLV